MNYSCNSFPPYCHGRPQWMELVWPSYRTLQQANTSVRSNHWKLLKKLILEDIQPQTLCVVCLTGHTWYRWQLTGEGRMEEKPWTDMWNRRLTNQEYCWTVKLCDELICSVVINVVWVDGRCDCKCDCYESLLIHVFRGPITNSSLNQISWRFLWPVVCVPLTEPKAVKMFLEWLYISVGP